MAESNSTEATSQTERVLEIYKCLGSVIDAMTLIEGLDTENRICRIVGALIPRVEQAIDIAESIEIADDGVNHAHD